jgi:hypothetical protein
MLHDGTVLHLAVPATLGLPQLNFLLLLLAFVDVRRVGAARRCADLFKSPYTPPLSICAGSTRR